MAYVTFDKELAVAEDLIFGIGTVFQDRGAGTMINSDTIPYDNNYSMKEVIDYIITEPAANFVKKAGDTMTGNLSIDADNPAMVLTATTPLGLDEDSGYHFRNYTNYLMGKVQYNEANEWLGFLTYDGTGSAIPVASAYLKKTGLLATTNKVAVDPEDLVCKEYVEGNFPAGSWSFDGTVLDIVIP